MDLYLIYKYQIVRCFCSLVHLSSVICCTFLYTRHLLHVCPSWKRDPSSVALPEVSSIVFFYPVKRFFFFHQHVKFFLTRIEGLRTEDVVHCTDCKAHWGNVIVILGYINKINLIFWASLYSCGGLWAGAGRDHTERCGSFLDQRGRGRFRYLRCEIGVLNIWPSPSKTQQNTHTHAHMHAHTHTHTHTILGLHACTLRMASS